MIDISSKDGWSEVFHQLKSTARRQTMSMSLYIDRDNTVEQLETAPETTNIHMIQTMKLLGGETGENGMGAMTHTEVYYAYQKADLAYLSDPYDSFMFEILKVLRDAYHEGYGVYWA